MNVHDLRIKIRQANDDYAEGREGISNEEYDDLLSELRSLSPDDPLLDVIGNTPKTRMETLPIPMFSLDKVKSIEEIYAWASEFNLSLDTVICLSPKLDGISFSVDEEIDASWTRGDGFVGQRSDNHYKFMNKGCRSNCLSKVFTFGEAIMRKSKFLKYPQYSNARNMVGGTISGDKINPDILADIDYIRYGMVCKGESKLLSHSFVLSQLNMMNSYQIPYATVSLREITESMLIDFFHAWSSDYHLDGIVITVDSIKIADSLGRRGNGNPNYSIAFKGKFAEDIMVTSTDHLEWNVSKRGYLKPVGIIDPVLLNGAEVDRVNLYNYRNVISTKVGAGSVIKMRRSGVVIPKVEEVVAGSLDYDTDVPKRCPACNGEVAIGSTGVELICLNKVNCRGVTLAKIVSFFDIMGVEEFGEGLIRKLFDHGYNSVRGILAMTVEDLELIDGFGAKKANNIYSEIHSKMSGVSMPKLQHASCCFENIGEDTFDKINIVVSDHRKSCNPDSISIRSVLEDKIGVAVSSEFLSGVSSFAAFHKDISEFITIKAIVPVSDKLKGWVVVFTGFRSDIMENKIKSNGGMVGNSITKATTHLVMKEKGTGTIKEQKAVKQGIKILTMDEFNSLI